MRDILYYRLQRSKELSLRNDILKLEPYENIKRIVITLHEDSSENSKVQISLGNELPIIIDCQHSYFYGFKHLLTDNSNCDEKLDCTIRALTSDCIISVSVNFW